MTILVTGSAGFVGSALCLRLLSEGHRVVGVDNHCATYDPALKEARVARHIDHANYTHLRVDLTDRDALEEVFVTHKPRRVVNLGGQAGVRDSVKTPHRFILSNVVGFTHILEGCRHHKVEHLVYASTSSVYGANTAMPYSVHHNTDHPLSLYAASKKANEHMAHSYSHLFGLPTTGLRFFTVYGPWGRPDMALFVFIKAALEDKPIKIFNHGNHQRDFTYIDDIVEGIVRVLAKPAQSNLTWDGDDPDPGTSHAPWRLYNIGNSRFVELMDYVTAMEKSLGFECKKEFLPLQMGDVPRTYADVEDLTAQFGYKPATAIEDGVKKAVDWYRQFYKK